MSGVAGSLCMAETKQVITPRKNYYNISGKMDYFLEPIDTLDFKMMSAEQVDKLFEKSSGMNKFNYGRSTIFFRFTLDNPTKREQTVILTSFSPVLKMYLAEEKWPETWVDTQRAGLMHIAEQKPFYLAPAFELKVAPGTHRYYLKVNPEGHPFLPIFELRSKSRFERESKRLFMLLNLIFGGVIAILLYNMSLMYTFRSKEFLFYFCYLASFLIFQSVVTGHISYFSFAVPVADLWYIWLGISCLSLAFFVGNFMYVGRRQNPRFFNALRLYILACLPIAFYSIMPRWLGVAHIVLLTVTGLILFCSIAIKKYQQGLKSARYLIGAIAVLGLVKLLSIFISTGVSIPGIEMRGFLQLGTLAQCLLLSFAVADKFNTVKKSGERYLHSISQSFPRHKLDFFLSLRSDYIKKEYCTIMVIDMAGYSTLLRHQDADAARLHIKGIMEYLTKITQSYGGLVDKTLGDGLLCLFGYGVKMDSDRHFAENALECAIAIQRTAVEEILKSQNMGTERLLFHPFRIGISSGDIELCNMGDHTKLELEIFGPPVILATRYESCCELFKIIIDKNTLDHIMLFSHHLPCIRKRLIPIKHHNELQVAYEYDPFSEQVEQLILAKKAYWANNQTKQEHERTDFKNDDYLIRSEYGIFKPVNFSYGGMCLVGQSYLGKNTIFEIFLPYMDNVTGFDLLNPISVKVVWGTHMDGDNYIHGVQYIGLNDKVKSLLVKILQKQNLKIAS
jgi:class 3 adenylate cyclase